MQRRSESNHVRRFTPYVEHTSDDDIRRSEFLGSTTAQSVGQNRHRNVVGSGHVRVRRDGLQRNMRKHVAPLER